MRIFGKAPEKRDMSQASVHIGMNRPTWTKMTVEKAVQDGYSRCGWVYRAVSLIMQSAGSVPWYIYKDSEIVEHPLSNVLLHPNEQFSRQDVFELLIAWNQLTGNSYLFRNIVDGKTTELFPFSPDRLAPVGSSEAGVLVAGYTSRDRNGVMSEKINPLYTPENIIHFKLINPADPLVGIGPLSALSRTIDIDVEQQEFNKAASENRGVIDTIISFGRDIGMDQYKTITKSIMERITGKNNARKPLVIGSDAKVQRLGLTPAEMDFIESRKMSREEIFIVFGVPPQLAGVQDSSTYNNYSVSKRIFWDATIIPLLDDTKSTLNMAFEEELGDGYEISYDVSNISAMRENEGEKADTSKTYFDMGIPVKNLNDKFSLGLDQFENWDKPWSGGKMPAATSGEKRKKKRLAEWNLVPTEFRNVQAEQDRLSDQVEGWISDEFEALLSKQQKDVFAAIDRGEDPTDVIMGDKDTWLKAMNEMAFKVAFDFADTIIFDERGKAPELETRAAATLEELIRDYLIVEATMLTDLSNLLATTVAKVISQLADALSSSLSISALQQAIIDTGVFSESRALMLSRTLGGTAASIGQLSAGQEAGATKKTWMDSGFNVRDIHQARDGETVEIKGKFSDQGYGKPRYPLDAVLEPADRVNCRCSMTFSYD